MLLPPLIWSLSPRAVLIAQGKRDATVIPIFAEIQGRLEVYLDTHCLFGHISVEVECKIWVRVIDEIKVKTAFVEEKKKEVSEGFKSCGWEWSSSTGCLDFWRQDPSQKGLRETKQAWFRMTLHDERFKILLHITTENNFFKMLGFLKNHSCLFSFVLWSDYF